MKRLRNGPKPRGSVKMLLSYCRDWSVFASKLGLMCLAWSGGCVEGVLEGGWERHDVLGGFFFRFDLSDFFGQNG